MIALLENIFITKLLFHEITKNDIILNLETKTLYTPIYFIKS